MGTIPGTMRNRKRKIQKSRKHQKSNIHLPQKETRNAHRKNASSGERLMA
jgi:hypothetical protein